MFGRNRWFDLIVSAILLALSMGALAAMGMFVVVPLRFSDDYLRRYVLTLDQTSDAEQATRYLLDVKAALEQGLLNGALCAVAVAVLWLLLLTFWRPSRPGSPAERGYVWLTLLVVSGVAAWLASILPLADFATQPGFVLPYRVLVTGWTLLSFVVATWLVTPGIALPGLGPLAQIRFALLRPLRGVTTKGNE